MIKHIFNTIIIAGALIIAQGCSKTLDVVPPSEFAPDNVLTSESGIKAVLFSAYANQQLSTPSRLLINNSDNCTDIGFNSGGNENLAQAQIITFTWDAALGTLLVDYWAPAYRVIRDANIVIENAPNATMSDAKRKLYIAEAKFLRAYSYDFLYKMFGPVPLRNSSTTPPQLARATEDEMRAAIETDLQAAIPDLPNPGTEEAFGRANKGSAHAVLAKWYLTTKQWQKAADETQKLIALNYYQLFPDYTKMFTVENERNREMIMIRACKNENNYGNWYTAGALPPNFRTTAQIPEFTWTTSMANFATQYRLRSPFVNSFDLVNDRRAVLIIRSYVNNTGATVNLMSTVDNARALKYWDNATVGNHSGNDVPDIRYADILLCRAEALNELTGPTQPSLDLINLVRTRAGIGNLTMTDATSKDVLRDLILRERGWELYAEGKRREDMIRHGKFISSAKARGIAAAADKHVVFPIPQGEIDANKDCLQNTGY